MRSTVLLCVLLLFGACTQRKAQEDYSEKFYEAFSESRIILHHDSLIFPIESGMEDPILIPTILILNQEYVFHSKNDLSLKLKRKNYTDINYELWDEKLIEMGRSSLRSSFHLGAESVKTSEGEFLVTDYDIESSAYLNTIKIGNTELTNGGVTEVYVYTIPKLGSKFEKSIGIEELWKLKN